MCDTEQVITITSVWPTLTVRQLEVSHPGADDDGLWFLGWPGSNFEAQIESLDGMCPFLIETDERDARFTTSSIEDIVETLVKLLHLWKPGAVHDM
jgi:hypothetical protein